MLLFRIQTSLGDRIKVQVEGETATGLNCRVWVQVLDRYDGSYIVRLVRQSLLEDFFLLYFRLKYIFKNWKVSFFFIIGLHTHYHLWLVFSFSYFFKYCKLSYYLYWLGIVCIKHATRHWYTSCTIINISLNLLIKLMVSIAGHRCRIFLKGNTLKSKWLRENNDWRFKQNTKPC